MPLRVRLGVVMLLASVFSACGGTSAGSGNTDPGQPPPTNTISGTVTFKGAPLAVAAVTNFLTNTNTVFGVTTTDANGRWSFSGLSTSGNVAADYQIYVNKAGYAFTPSVTSGAKAERFDYTGQYQGVGIAPSGFLFNVIDFISLPNATISGATFTAYDGTNPPIALAATGQQTSYATGDDADMNKGVAWSASNRFTDNLDGTVTDSLTGLVWLKDAGCLGAAFWADALVIVNTLASGNCGLSDGSTAGQWRMPNLNEMESLIDVSAANPALPANNPFRNVSNGVYWSSTPYYGGVTGSSDAWPVRLSDGRYMNDSSSNVMASTSNNIWAVKGTGGNGKVKLQATGFRVPYNAGDDGSVQAGVRLPAPRMIDNSNGTITDTLTGLTWLKEANCLSGTWTAALAAVNALASGQCGLADGSWAGEWRMPNRNELESLSDRAQTNLAEYFDYTYLNPDGSVYQFPIFKNYIGFQFYWTSTTNAANTSEAWTVFSCDFGVYDIPKTNTGYTLAVR